jgi:proteic killer suppression protein
MIRSFGTKDTANVWFGIPVKRFPKDVQELARRKLRMLNNSTSIQDLVLPRGNGLEQLKGDRKGQFSIRLNERLRICFLWKDGDCNEVEIVNYHS